MTSPSLRTRLILALVVIVTLTSTLFAGGVMLIKQQLEAVIFGEMVRDQLQVLDQQLEAGTYSEASLFENWMLYIDERSPGLHPDLRVLEEGSHHSVKIADNYYQVEVAEHHGEKVYLTYDITDWENQEHEVLEMLAYGIGLVLFAAIIMGWQASKTVLAPVTSLAKRVSEIQPKQRNVRIAQEFKGSEIALIATAFDRYMERLDQFVDRERSFTAAASHELRTPLSVMMGALDVLDAQEHNPASRRALSRIKRACAEMLAFIEATLFLSREDSTTINQGEAVDLAKVIQSLADDNAAALLDKNIALKLDIKSAVMLQQADSIVRIMLGNILRNAMEHTEAGEISITLSDKCLLISDTGSGIPEQDLPHVFDRSYTTKAGGTGLGLNLVKRICDRFNWNITINSGLGKGTQVSIEFT
tara:strand:+ start:1261 stop:2511 length:1251 start_codon:yes stop_codon:yes gene_type:complete